MESFDVFLMRFLTVNRSHCATTADELSLPINLPLRIGCRRFPFSPSEGEKAGMRGNRLFGSLIVPPNVNIDTGLRS